MKPSAVTTNILLLEILVVVTPPLPKYVSPKRDNYKDALFE